MSKPHILFIDNFDSFTFNLVDALSQFGAEVDVYRNDICAETALSITREKHSTFIVLSPGPGEPKEAGSTMEVIQKAAKEGVPLFGVCLGHQAIAEVFGGEVGAVKKIVHGKKSQLKHFGHPLFSGLPKTFDAGRYHSLAVKRLPENFNLIATGVEDDVVMAMAHHSLPIYGVQFHPESILTTYGQVILNNVFKLARAEQRTTRKKG